MRDRGAGTTTVIRPAGLAHGATSFGAAWLAAAMIAMLTGATAVVILLAIGFVALVAACISGWPNVRRAQVSEVSTADVTVIGDELHWHVRAAGSSLVYAEVRVADDVVAAGWLREGLAEFEGVAPRRGVHTTVEVRTSSAGRMGLLWWRRQTTLAIAELSSAPRAADVGAPLERSRDEAAGDRAASVQAGRDDVDGVRAWRDGDEVSAVHWPSTLRSGEFVVRQRQREHDEQWLIEATSGTGDASAEAARVRHTAERGLAAGARVAVRVDGGDPTSLPDRAAVLRWCAAFEPDLVAADRQPWWRRPIGGSSPEPEQSLAPAARWAVAGAAAVPLVMMLGPLGYDTASIGVVLAAMVAGAWVSIRVPDRRSTLRQLLGLATGLAVAAALIDVGQITSVVSSLRFLLPQVLVTLVVMQGFECHDRRAARVSLACSALLTAYAAGIRIDGQLAAWLLLAVTAAAFASQSVTRPDRRRAAPTHTATPTATATETASTATGRRARVRGGAIRLSSGVGAGLAVLAILAVMPVPRGPAQLTLPSWLQEIRPVGGDGALAAPDGSPLLGGGGGNARGGDGGGGGYPGFSPTMDTSLRGDLGDAIVLRVRAPYPDFWRGQTFTKFDGRTWYVDSEVGTRTEGPDHSIGLATGDVSAADEEEFIQTFYAEVDLPNIVFAANRPARVLLDAPVWQRADGALRADVVLPEGSAYTVVSYRSGATAALLRGEGDLARFDAPSAFLETPASTSERTRDLAQQLALGSTNTYDTILAIQRWLGDNVTYDLDAPVPPTGADAVDHFLFESRQGFCEQIATATAMMLRSLGVPARVATGYVPSDRDEVAGVWISRARDAHAWVEVRFPTFGWVAFDPTASVPLSGEAPETTIGGDLVRALGTLIADHVGISIIGGFVVATSLVILRLIRRWWFRRRRGRWGVLQDRFVIAALRRGAPPTAPNADLARVFDDDTADALAAALDASAFAAGWADEDARYEGAVATLRELERHV